MVERKTQKRFTPDTNNKKRKRVATSRGQITGETLRSQTSTAKRDAALKQRAKLIDSQLSSKKFGNINEIKEELKKVPKEVRPYLSVNIDQLENQKTQKIAKVKKWIKKAEEQKEEAKEDNNRPRFKEFRDRERYLKGVIGKLEKGALLNTKEIRNTELDLGDVSRRREKVDQEKNKSLKQISAEISRGIYSVDKINYQDGKPTSVEVQGTKVPLKGLSDKQLKNIKLSSVKKADQISELKKEINKATSGNKPDTIKLFNLGFTGDQVTSIVAAYGTGEGLKEYENTKLAENVYDALYDEETGKRNPFIAVDSTTETQAFKLAVNKQLKQAEESGSADFKPLDYKKDLNSFRKEYDKLLQKRKEIFDKIKDTGEVRKDLNLNQNNYKSLRNKVLTGQSMSPKQMQQYRALQIAAGEKLERDQLKNLKNGILSPVVYSLNLKKRFAAGEKNPLYNDLTKVFRFTGGVGKGALKESGDILNSVFGVKGLTINSKGESFDGIVAKGARGGLEYFQKLIRETAGTDRKTREIVKDDLTKVWQDSKVGAGNVIDATKAAASNPVLTLLTASAAINDGVISSRDQFLKNPDENLGRALVWLFPGTIIKGATKGVKAVGSTAEKAKDINQLGRFFKKDNFSKLKAKFAGKPLQEQERALTITALKDRGINLRDQDLNLIKTNELKKTLNQLTPKKIKKGKKKIKSRKISKSLAKKRLLNNAFEEKFGVKLSDDALNTLTENSLRNLLGAKKPKLLNRLKSLKLFKTNGNIIPRKSIKVSKEKALLNTAFEEKFGVKLAPETLATLSKNQLNNLLGTNSKKKFTNLLDKFKVPRKVKVNEIKPNKQILNTAFEEKFGVKLSDDALDTISEKNLKKLTDTKKKSELRNKLASSGLYIYNKNIERYNKVKDLVQKSLKQKKRIDVPEPMIKEALRRRLRNYDVKYSPSKTQSSSVSQLKKDLAKAIQKKEDIQVDQAVKKLDDLISKQINNKEIFVKLDKNEIKQAIAQDLKSKGLANLPKEQVLKTSIPKLQSYYKKPKTLKSTKEPVKEVKIPLTEEKKAVTDLLRKQGIKISNEKAKETSLKKLKDRLEKAKTANLRAKEQEATKKLSKGQLITQLRQLGIKYSSDQAKKLSVEDLRNKLAREKSLIKAAKDVEIQDVKDTVKKINLNEPVSKPARESLRKNKQASLRVKQQLEQKQKSLLDETDELQDQIKEITISPTDVIKSRIKLKSNSLQDNLKDLEGKMRVALKNSDLFDVKTSQSFKNALKSIPTIAKAVKGIKSINGQPVNYLAVNKSELNEIKSAFPELANKNIVITKQEFENLTDNLPKTDKKSTTKSDVIIISDNKLKSKVKELSKGRLKGKKISDKPPRRPKRTRLPSTNFNSNVYKDRVIRYIAKYRERRDARRPYNKRNNPVVTKTLSILDTRNRALKRVAELADRKTVRSIDIEVADVTSRKKKDIKEPDLLKKFDSKQGSGPTLKLVEKASAAIDTPGEKRELKRTRRQAKKAKSNKKTTRKTNTSKKSKKSS